LDIKREFFTKMMCVASVIKSDKTVVYFKEMMKRNFSNKYQYFNANKTCYTYLYKVIAIHQWFTQDINTFLARLTLF
jgi:hypothetical protein